MRIFVDVDVQNDFCEPSGALYVSGSPNALYRSIVAHAQSNGAPIVGSVDSHAFDAWEFASSGRTGPDGQAPGFPDHCVKGTWGWMKVEGTLPKRFRFVPNVEHANVQASLVEELVRGEAQGIYFEKEVYSLFANPNAAGVLDELRRSVSTPLECVVFGVATDYCVRAACLGLAERGYATIVLEDAIRGITGAGTRDALEAMRAAGVRVTTVSELGLVA
jgi:nicotinamidase/pyrazinamidase